MKPHLLAALTCAFCALSGVAFAGPQTVLDDPMRTGMWSYHQEEFLGDPANIQFSDAVKIHAPVSAEDSLMVPLLIDATAIENVRKIVVTADYSPIPHILTFYPEESQAKLALRFKIDQGTAIRASVETEDGQWHVGSTYIDAAGGGCTAPAAAYANADWEEKLGEIHGQVWADAGRARLILDHPMDTGLADGIPVFIVEHLDFNAPDGERLARIELHEPVSEDPAFTLYFDEGVLPASLSVEGRDNNGNPFSGLLTSNATH